MAVQIKYRINVHKLPIVYKNFMVSRWRFTIIAIIAQKSPKKAAKIGL